MSDSLDADLLNIFRDEVSEYLDTLNTYIMQIETADTLDQEAVRELNRVAHSMKGASRAVGLKVVETIGHYMEEVFDAALKHNLDLTPDVCDLLYDGLDLIQTVVDGGESNEEALAEVLVQLEQVVVQGATDESPSEVQDEPEAVDDDVVVANDDEPAAKSNGASTSTTELPEVEPMATPQNDNNRDTSTVVVRPAEESIRVPVGKLDHLMAEVSELLVSRMQAEDRMREVQSLRGLHGKWRREWQGIRAAYIRLARRLQDEQHEQNEQDSDMAAIFKFLEANQRNLLAANQHLTQLVQALGQDNLRLTTLSDQLQDDVSGMRMVSFETLLGGFQRIVRDLARDTAKEVFLDVDGMMVEVDKTVLDALKDPIMHLLRNAVDHGIELPEKRQAERQAANGAGDAGGGAARQRNFGTVLATMATALTRMQYDTKRSVWGLISAQEAESHGRR